MNRFYNKFIISLAVLFSAAFPSFGIECQVPRGLEVFSLMNVLEIEQDSLGAIWLNTTRGLHRYNGHSLERLSDELPRKSLLYDGSAYIYALRRQGVTRFDIRDLASFDITYTDLPPALVASRETPSLPASSGKRFEALANGGFRVVDAGGRTRDYLQCGGRSISTVRGFVEMDDGTVYIGAANGLFSMDATGLLQAETVSSIESCPICCLFKDRDGSLWIGTYHNGVFVSTPSAFPLHAIDAGLKGMMTNGTVRDSRGRVLIFTDGQGIIEYDPAQARLVRNGAFPPLKYQGVFFDKAGECIWASSFHEGIKCFSLNGRHLRSVRFASSLGVALETITPVCRVGRDLLIGGLSGLYAFCPETEKEISRRIEGIDGLAYSFATASDGTVWIAGNGVYTYSDGKVSKVIIGKDASSWENTQQCYSIDFSRDGGVWIGYARKGVVFLKDGQCRYYNSANSGLQDDYTYAISALSNGDAVVSTATGLSIIGKSVINYPFAMVDAIRKLDADRLLLCTRGGVMLYDARGILAARENHDVRIDRVCVDGERFSGRRMKYDQNNISFDISTYSYSPHLPVSFTTILEGYDKAPARANIETPILYRKLPKGKYTFRVTAWTPDGRKQSEDAFTFRIQPPWYASLVARTGFVLLLLLVGGILLNLFNTRRRLSSELRKKEEENRERTRFFIDLSNKIRTPLNLIVGKLERYFKDFGSRSSGSENIEDIYLKSRELRGMVSAFVDSQNEMAIEAEDAGGNSGVVKDAKFFNAALGVVERNLFSPELDVSFLCRELHVGKTMLTQRLKQAGGMTPRALIESVRLEHAAEMLRQGTHRVSEIADLLCFCSPKHFSERFRLKYGCNPSAYK